MARLKQFLPGPTNQIAEGGKWHLHPRLKTCWLPMADDDAVAAEATDVAHLICNARF